MSLEYKKYCRSIFIDIRQTFDKVWHYMKFNVASHFIMNLFKSYLNNGQFRTRVSAVNGDVSDI